MNNSVKISLFIHGLVVLFFILLVTISNAPMKPKKIDFAIIEKEIKVLKKKKEIIINGKRAVKANDKVVKKVRKVFGAKRKTITDNTGTVQAKIGNTLTKKEDEKVLRDDEDDSLPVPAEEYLVTSMPRAINEVRPQYPSWAKEQKITGRVVFDILIDREGRVRQIKLLQGLHPELDLLAKEALLKFKFRPAFIEKKATAVRINYAIRYTLES